MDHTHCSYVILLEEEDSWDGDTEMNWFVLDSIDVSECCGYNCRELHLICEINLINKFG